MRTKASIVLAAASFALVALPSTSVGVSAKILIAPTADEGDASPVRPAEQESGRGFGRGGIVRTSFDGKGSSFAEAVVVGRDGKIIALGGFSYRRVSGGRPFYVTDMALARYLSDGRLDPTFGAGGKVRRILDPKRSAGVRAVAVQRDGKIVVGGVIAVPGTASPTSHFLLNRYTQDGRLDKNFGQRGTVETSFGADHYAQVSAVLIQPDGQIVVAGGNGADFALARYNRNGSLDRHFGKSGKVVTDVGSLGGASAAALERDGKIVLTGKGFGPGGQIARFALVRYTPSGRLDPTFGQRGKVFTGFGKESEDGSAALTIQRDGKIVAAGWAGGADGMALTRYERNGSLDTTFGVGGKVLTDLGSISDSSSLSAVANEPDGKLVAIGVWESSRNRSLLVRYTPSGKLDPSFGVRGKLLTASGVLLSASPGALAIQGDGKILVAGRGGPTNKSSSVLIRFKRDGQPDS